MTNDEKDKNVSADQAEDDVKVDEYGFSEEDLYIDQASDDLKDPKVVDSGLTDDNIETDSNVEEGLRQSETSDYFEDDDLKLAEDEILYEDPESIAIRNSSAIVTWSIRGLYNEDGKIKGKYSLRNNPPTLYVESNMGDKAEFLITKDTSRLLSKLFKDVNNAFYGIRPIEERTFKEKLVGIWQAILRNKVKAIFLGVFVLGFLTLAFVF